MVEFEKLLLQIFILGWIANIFIEMFKKAVKEDNYTLMLAWCIGSLVALFANFGILKFIDIQTIDGIDKLLTGAILGNISRFLHDISKFIVSKKNEANPVYQI